MVNAFIRRRRRDSYKMRNAGYLLGIFRSNKHTYAYLTNEGRVLFGVSNAGKSTPDEIKDSNNIKVSEWIGKQVADKLKSMSIDRIAINKSGYKFHGRIERLVQTIRESGIKC